MGLDPFDDDGFPWKTRKRPRASASRRVVENDDEPAAVVSRVQKPLKIGNSDEVWEFYSQRFRNCQQTACKLIAKAWVKAVEPKKQSNHPYTGKDEKAPDWWPKPWGTGKDDRVRHKEPDHLYKPGMLSAARSLNITALGPLWPWSEARKMARQGMWKLTKWKM
jgi:hypothetical protein